MSVTVQIHFINLWHLCECHDVLFHPFTITRNINVTYFINYDTVIKLFTEIGIIKKISF